MLSRPAKVIVGLALLPLLLGADHFVAVTAEPGTYIVRVVVGAGGGVSLEQIEPVALNLDRGSDPGSPPPVNPDTLSPLAKKVYERTRGLDDPATANRLATVYRQAADRLANGEIQSGDTAWKIVATLSDLVLEGDLRAQWQPWRNALRDDLADLARRGTLDHQQALRDIADGLSGSGGASGLSVIVIIKLVALVVDAARRGEGLSLQTLRDILEALGGL